jgi:hypothetical protein
MILEKFRQQARAAHNGTSFSPEKRGDQMIAEWSPILDEDLKALAALGVSAEGLDNYQQGFERLFSNWLGAKSRCISTMITGPANFPTRRAQKYNNWADGAFKKLQEYREKRRAGYERANRKAAIAEAGGPLEMAKTKLVELQQLQVYMKAVNAAHKKYLKDSASLDKNTELSEKAKTTIRTYVPQYSWEPHPFPPYALTNNNACIKNTELRIKDLEGREKLAEKVAERDLTFEGGYVIVASEDDRLRIFHHEKPAPEKIQLLKKNGFKWSPFNKCWQRQITINAKHALRAITGIDLMQ